MNNSETIELRLSDTEQQTLVETYVKDNMSELSQIEFNAQIANGLSLAEALVRAVINEQVGTVLVSYTSHIASVTVDPTAEVVIRSSVEPGQVAVIVVEHAGCAGTKLSLDTVTVKSTDFAQLVPVCSAPHIMCAWDQAHLINGLTISTVRSEIGEVSFTYQLPGAESCNCGSSFSVR